MPGFFTQPSVEVSTNYILIQKIISTGINSILFIYLFIYLFLKSILFIFFKWHKIYCKTSWIWCIFLSKWNCTCFPPTPLPRSQVFLILEVSTNYILIQKIFSTGIQYGITSYKSIQALPCLWWKSCFKMWLC